MTRRMRGFLASTWMLVLATTASFAANLEIVGRWDGGGRGLTSRVHVLDASHVVIDQGRWIKVLDVSAPEAPRVVGSLELEARVAQGVVAGGHLYVPMGVPGDALGVIDLSDPTRPALLTTYSAPDIGSVTADGARAFVNAASGIIILDIADPSNPIELGVVGSPSGRFYGPIAVAGNDLVGFSYAGLEIWDVADPAQPVLRGTATLTLDQPGCSGFSPKIGSMTLRENFVYVSADYAKTCSGGSVEVAYLRIVDITDRGQPRLVSTTPLESIYAGTVEVAGGRAYVGTYYGVILVDVTSPAAPEVTGMYPGLSPTVSHGRAYVARGWPGGFEIFDLTVPLNPSLRAQIGPETSRIAADGTRAYLVDAAGTLKIYEVAADPSHPAELGSLALSVDRVYDLAASGSFVYFAGANGVITIVDVSEPERPIEVGFSEIFGGRTIAVTGTTVVVADVRKLGVFDVSVPAAPVLLGSVPLTGPNAIPSDLEVRGTLAFMSYGNGFRICDLSDPSAPRELISAFDAGAGFTTSIDVTGDLFFVGRTIWNVSDPSQPRLIGQLPSWSFGYFALRVDGSRVHVANGYEIRTFDVTDPARPVELGTARPLLGGARSIALLGNLLLAVGEIRVNEDAAVGNLRVYDLSIPQPPPLGSYGSQGFAGGVRVVGDRALVADGEGGLTILDVSNPANPTETGREPAAAPADRVEIDGAKAYVQVGLHGAYVVDVSDPWRPVEEARIFQSDPARVPSSSETIGAAEKTLHRLDWDDLGYDQWLVSLDVSDPASPALLGSLRIEGGSRATVASGDRVYLSGFDTALSIANVSDPSSPFLEGGYKGPANPRELLEDIDVADGVVCGVGVLWDSTILSYFLRLVDVSNPTSPAARGSLVELPVNGRYWSIGCSGGLAYVAGYSDSSGHEILLFDIRSPAGPIEVGRLPIADAPRDVVVAEDLAYVALGSSGVWIIGPTDSDADDVYDFRDNCVVEANIDQTDRDLDGFGDACDNCNEVFNPEQDDTCSTQARCASADVNSDSFSAGRVDGLDLARFAEAWNSCPTGPGSDRYDPTVNLDRIPGEPGACVGAADFHLFMRGFARQCS